MSTTDAVPKPGSSEACARGCTCPILDNAHGAGRLGMGREWYITAGCPLHAPNAESGEPRDV